MNKMKLQNKICLVTGGARGIGKNIAASFLKEGAKVVIFDLDQKQGKATEVEFTNQYGKDRVLYLAVDISNPEDVKLNVEKVLETHQNIDVLVNNAGITKDNLIMRMSLEDWNRVLEINLTGAFILCKNVVRSMIKNKGGKIINVSSIVGIHGNAGQSNYSASKAGLIGLTKSLAKEFAGKNIQVNAVAPGYIDTDMTRSLADKAKNKMLEIIPSGRLGTVDDVARAILFLASSDSDYITGFVLNVDGGMGI
ncbi:MAG: 3-oxoacyl-[acyl-carrier-protein] reductase [Actinomycetia bacterium]|nr:3-oxoacyl-[acyl-carrier-protein] reductase [Actinomycetes bacterium]